MSISDAAAALPSPTLLERLLPEHRLRAALLLASLTWLVVTVGLPLLQILAKSLQDAHGHWQGLANFRTFFAQPALSHSLWHSLTVSAATTVLSVTLGFGYAYALTRTALPAKPFFRSLAMAPLFAPTMLLGINLIYLFGRKGLVTTGCFGHLAGLLGFDPAVDIGLYGPVGIIIAETVFTFPQAVLILGVALSAADARLLEAAKALGASRTRIFCTVTLPGARHGLFSAVIACFILAFTDFGAPKVVGGQYGVLATDIYKQVIGQQNFAMGATVSVVLLLPTVVAFLLDQLAKRRQTAQLTSRSVPLAPGGDRWADFLGLVYCGLIAVALLVFMGTGLYAALVKVWPYDLSLSLRHFRFGDMGGGGYAALANSARMALFSALVGTAITFTSAYLVEKSRGLPWLRQTAALLSILPLALPGLVIGLAYIFFFNAPGWTIGGLTLPNPCHVLYATMGILVVSNVTHFYAVAFLTAQTALRQLDAEYEAVSESMGVPFYRTFWRVTVPVCLPAIVEIAQFFFVNSMATISAVIFLYSADIPLASVAVANMDDAGDIAPAAAMSLCIVLINVGARLGSGALLSGILRQGQRWRRRVL